MKRLTVHLKRVKKTTEVKEGRSISKIHNTLSFKVKDESEANKAMEECSGVELDGRAIKCSEATPRKTEH